MQVVRQRMIKPLLTLALPLLGLLSSCNPTELTPTGARSSIVTNTDGSLDNKAYVYLDSPYTLGGPTYGPSNANMKSFLDRNAVEITTNPTLTGNCTISYDYKTFSTTINDCIRSLSNAKSDVDLPRKADRTYIYDANTPEFYQTNLLFHISKASNVFFDKLGTAYDLVRSSTDYSIPKSIPAYLKSSKLFWFKAVANSDSKIFNRNYLTAYSQCELDGNASFSPAGPTLCFGGMSTISGFWFVQDPSIVYHEFGHGLVSIMLNMRNGTSTSDYHPFRSSLGTYGYDEANALNEGIADYYSYIINKREMIGEYALGRTANQARPLSEASSMHMRGISETSEGRLSYPQYLLYDPNHPDEVEEDEHYAGQIITHYLVALTKNLKTQCNLTSEGDGGHDKVTTYMLLLLAETLSELGDLNARGIDYATGGVLPSNSTHFFSNMDKTNSLVWSQIMNQVNYRRFFQVFGKNINKYITGNLCIGFDKNESEKLLDDYGLLLFKTYNDNGNSTKNRGVTFASMDSTYSLTTPTNPTQVSEVNRSKSLLVSKQLLDLGAKTTANPDRVTFYLIDNASDMNNLLKDLLFKGYTVPLSSNASGTVYNNNNLKISPGEVVGVIPNLLNNSNSTMAGVQLLANDWDHVDITDQNTGNFKPCVVDSVTTVDQGGEAANTCTTTDTNYQRLIKNSSTGKFPASAAAPVCLVQIDDGTSTKWVSQNEFRKKQGLSLLDKDCLGYTTSNTTDPDFTFNPHECLMRFLPGGNEAFFSKIDPQKTFYESVTKEMTKPSMNPGNVLLIEVNKWIPPGTKFRCRLRARFSNCSDCYTDGTNSNDDFLDHEMSGQKPYKVINFEFDIND
jgi:hypothetical protein